MLWPWNTWDFLRDSHEPWMKGEHSMMHFHSWICRVDFQLNLPKGWKSPSSLLFHFSIFFFGVLTILQSFSFLPGILFEFPRYWLFLGGGGSVPALSQHGAEQRHEARRGADAVHRCHPGESAVCASTGDPGATGAPWQRRRTRIEPGNHGFSPSNVGLSGEFSLKPIQWTTG